jgi:NAD(P)-dependent dehydrogenase (short-subunit alcohol dehydrogenase family)
MENRVAVVLGAGSEADNLLGVGAASAVALSAAGFKIIVVDMDQDRAQATSKAIEAGGGESLAVVADATVGAESQRVVQTTLEQFGRIDALVCNIASSFARPLLDCSEDDWDRAVRINGKSVFLACKAAIPEMIRSGGGSITCISSIGVYRGHGTGVYAASKGTIEPMMRDIAFSYGLQGIRANVVAPGYIKTSFAAHGHVPAAMASDDIRSGAALLGTTGTGTDVAGAVVYLASAGARWITGITIPVDAGVLVAAPLALQSRTV